MAMTRSEITAKYDAVNSKLFTIKLNRKTDADIIEKLDNVPSKQGFIKAAIRAYMAENNKPAPVPVSVPDIDSLESEDTKMKTYRIKPDYIDSWGSFANDETVLTEQELIDQAKAWDMSVDTIMEQVYPNTPAEIKWYLGK